MAPAPKKTTESKEKKPLDSAAADDVKSKVPAVSGTPTPATAGAGVPLTFAADMEADAGKGLSQAAEDNIVPLVYVLQANSPQVQRSQQAYLRDAVAGDLWKRNSAKKEVVKGEDGFLFQPCHFSKCWVEWRPLRGGFVARHDERPADAIEKEVRKEDGELVMKWVRPNNNEVVESREHTGFADGEPYTIPFSSSGHTVSRQWMQLMNQFYIPGTSKIAPSWSRRYRLTTTQRTNKKNQSWYVIKAVDAGWVESWDEYNRGKALNSAFESGEKKSAAPDDAVREEEIIEGTYSDAGADHGARGSEVENDGPIPF